MQMERENDPAGNSSMLMVISGMMKVCGRYFNAIVWCAFVVLALNVVAFAVRSSNPTLMADDWYFLDVFVRKAIEHSLTFADFFTHRANSDHSEPFIKLIILWCLKSFHLDLSVEAIAGAFIAIGYALLFRCFVISRHHPATKWVEQLAWLTIAAALLSLNSTELWSWAENSMQYSSDILIPVFLWSVWRAYTQKKYALLPVITFLMAVVGDDNGVISAIAVLIALGFYFFLGKVVDKRSMALVIAEVTAVMLIVRIGYHFTPVIGGTKISPVGNLRGIYEQLLAGHWHSWISPPLVWGIVSRSFFPVGYDLLFKILSATIFIVMLALQVWFWIMAFRSEWNARVFIAICLMLVVYGWLAGILIYRAPVFGADTFSQTRYVRLYGFEVVSLVLMWLGSMDRAQSLCAGRRSRRVGIFVCLAFLVLQAPLSVTAWSMAPYIRAYYQEQARQTYLLSSNLSDLRVLNNCNAQLQICEMPLQERADLLGLLQKNHLSIFSADVIKAHPLLLNAASSLLPLEREQLLSGLRESSERVSLETVYGKIRSLVLRDGEGWPKPSVNVQALQASVVPLVLSGCWPSDQVRDFVSSWCGPDVSLVLRKPKISSGLHIQGWFPWSLYAEAGRSSPVTVTIFVNGIAVANERFASDEMLQIDVPEQALPDKVRPEGLLFITISVDGAFVPSKFSSSKDSRELSIKLSSVGFSTIRRPPGFE